MFLFLSFPPALHPVPAVAQREIVVFADPGIRTAVLYQAQQDPDRVNGAATVALTVVAAWPKRIATPSIVVLLQGTSQPTPPSSTIVLERCSTGVPCQNVDAFGSALPVPTNSDGLAGGRPTSAYQIVPTAVAGPLDGIATNDWWLSFHDSISASLGVTADDAVGAVVVNGQFSPGTDYEGARGRIPTVRIVGTQEGFATGTSTCQLFDCTAGSSRDVLASLGSGSRHVGSEVSFETVALRDPWVYDHSDTPVVDSGRLLSWRNTDGSGLYPRAVDIRSPVADRRQRAFLLAGGAGVSLAGTFLVAYVLTYFAPKASPADGGGPPVEHAKADEPALIASDTLPEPAGKVGGARRAIFVSAIAAGLVWLRLRRPWRRQ